MSAKNDPATIADALKRYIDAFEARRPIALDLSEHDEAVENLSNELQTLAGRGTALLFGDNVYIPFIMRNGIRVGYDRLSYLDLGPPRFPIITPIRPVDPDHPGNGAG